ncbi:MAG: methyltransferase [Rhodospirillales bacterium]|nr:methyltransferase [Rhodospirillales bacterium]
MTNEWDDYADEWDKDSSAREYADMAYAALKKLTPVTGLRVLDFGCGTGLLTEKMSPDADEIIALDGSEGMIKQLDQKNLPTVSTIADFLTTDLISSHELLEEKFDLIVASSVCSFLPDYPGTAKLLRSLLRPAGVYFQWDWMAIDGNSSFGLTEKNIRETLDKAGFKQIRITQPFTMKSSKGDMPVLMAFAQNT